MIGTLLMGRYRLTELVGSGGMANVYLARDEKEDREVAVKVLKDEHADNGVLVERFESEGRAGKLLHHRNIVRVYDTGEEGGRRFIVMEYARGVTLKEVIKQRISLDPEACIDIAVQVLRALAHAHAKGIVHRDVKPHNILLQANGDVKVYDFGIAQTIGEKRAGEEKTSVMGTVYYLSPEQARAEPAEVRSDIYSFGITLFEMLTGTVPFTGTSVIDVAKKHLNEEVPAPRSVDERIPKSLNDIVRKATRKNLRLRYRSAWEMRRDLMRARREPDGDFVRVKEERLPAGSEREKPQPDRARRRMYAIVGAVIVLVVVTVAVLVFGSVPPEQGQRVVSVLGLQQGRAESKLEDLGFVPDVVIEPDSEEPAGTVFRQEPAEGETLVPGGVVRIFVSAGVSMGTMPDVLDMKLSDAKAVIKKNNLTVGEVTQVTSDEPSGYVVRQDPEPGDELMPNSQVDLWVSAGLEELPEETAAAAEAP